MTHGLPLTPHVCPPHVQLYCVDTSLGRGPPLVAAGGSFAALNVFDLREPGTSQTC